MGLLAVGLSHRSTPVELLERAALGSDALSKTASPRFQAST